jgi:hypothetical protein
MVAAAALRKPSSARLPQAVRAEIHARKIALLAKPIAESRWCEGLAKFGHQEGQIFRPWHRVDRGCQLWQERDINGCRLSAAFGCLQESARPAES